MKTDFKKIILDNGLRVILVPQKISLAATVLVLVETGSKYETKGISGISHFLEHMCFKGTEKRPRQIDIAVELDGIGADYNAFTGHEYTGFFAKARPEHFEKILDVVSDIYLHQRFEPKEIDKERGAIIEEINMNEDIPMRHIQDVFMELLYGNQPAGWDIAGTKEVVKKLGRDDFVDYHNKHYVASSTIVVVAGKFDEEEAVEKIKKYFSGISESKKFPKEKTREEQNKPEIYLKYKETDQTHLILGVRAFDLFDERKYALDVLAGVLGGGMSSRLFQKVRTEKGAAYYIHADTDLFTDHGFMAVAAGINNEKIDEVVKTIVEEFKKISLEEISEEELNRVKEQFIGHLVIGLETSNRIASFYGTQEVLEKKLLNPTELIKKIQKVSAKDVLAVAKEIIRDNRLNLAVIGPFKEPERFEKILHLS